MRKEFTVKNNEDVDVKLAVRQPTFIDHEEADKQYSIKLATLIREPKNRRLLLRSELDSFLKENSIWTQKDEDRINQIRKDIDRDIKKLKRGGIKKSEGRKIAISISDKRAEIYQLNKKRQVYDDSTIESSAENEKISYFIYSCTVNAETGEKYWSSFEDMQLDKESEAYKAASNLVVGIVYNLDPDWEKNTPENKWLTKHKFLDAELYFVDPKTGEPVDKDGKPLKKIQEEFLQEVANLQGEIEEEQPFIDDDETVAVQDVV